MKKCDAVDKPRQKTQRKHEFSTQTDGYALGLTISNLLSSNTIKAMANVESAEIQKMLENMQYFIMLLTHYAPRSRPPLHLIQLAILYLQNIPEETLPAKLIELKLPSISMRNLSLLSKSLLYIAKYFDRKNPHCSASVFVMDG